MATNFPVALDDFINYIDGTTIMEATTLNNMQFAIEALEAKVGINSSVVTLSHDFKLAQLGSGDYIKLADSKTSGTHGGTPSAGSWNKRTVTEKLDTGNNIVVSSSVLVLSVGTYDCLISAPAYRGERHQLRLRNTTTNTTVLVGSSEECEASAFPQTRSFLVGRFTIAASQNIEIQHWIEASFAGQGFGRANGNAESEIYTIAEFWKR